MIYNTVHLNKTWARLPELTDVPVWVVSGKVDRFNVSGVAERIHKQLPVSEYVQWDECSHFGPLEKPALLAGLVQTVVQQQGKR